MLAVSPRHGLAGAAFAACLGVLPLALVAQPDFGDNTSRWADDGECDDPRFEGEGAATTLLDEDRGHDAADCRTLFEAGSIALRSLAAPAGDAVDFGDDSNEIIRRGRLEKGDDTLGTGEYADGYSFTGTAGERAVIDLRSGDFDPYLFIRAPSGEQFDNDDFAGDGSRSLLSLELAESGEYLVTVTSYEEGESGGYTLSIDVGPSLALTTRLERSGRLEAGDETLTTGEFVDRYDFEAAPGQHVSIALQSSAFDTYLILKDPSGEQTENDDAGEGTDVGLSSIEADLVEAGTYQVLVTSYESGESGAYSLVIDPSAPAERGEPATRDVTALTVGGPTSAELDGGEPR